MPKPLQLIVACSENRVIGRGGLLPFDIPEDKQWFHDQTANQTVLLGRICYETWPRALEDGRQPVVISSQPDRVLQSGRDRPSSLSTVPLVALDVTAALRIAQTLPGNIMICGGQRIYEETLAMVDRLLLTVVHANVDGDTWFPDWGQYTWRESWKRESADRNYRYTFTILERVR